MKILGYTVLGLLIAALAAVVVTASVLWSGFVLATLWAWFLVPTLKVAALTTLQAAGIATTIKFLTYQFNYKEFEDGQTESVEKWKKPVITLVFAFLYPLFALGFGWVLHQFV